MLEIISTRRLIFYNVNTYVHIYNIYIQISYFLYLDFLFKKNLGPQHANLKNGIFFSVFTQMANSLAQQKRINRIYLMELLIDCTIETLIVFLSSKMAPTIEHPVQRIHRF